MFREMRRKKQALPPEEAAEVLYRGTSGVLALSGDDGYPYAVPVSYVYDGEKLWFHGAKSGHKLDSIARCSKASFCVIDQDHVVPEEYTTYFRSVIAFGTIRVVTDEAQMREGAEKIALKYAPGDTDEGRQKAIEREWAPLCILEMTVELLTGKAAAALLKQSRP